MHITLRIAPGVESLRKGRLYNAIREATLRAARRDAFRIVHMSIQRNHVHLIVEAESKTALSKGVWGFEISAAKHINAAIGARTGTRRRGAVFADRYHRRALTSPRAVRHAIAYVLNNWRHHQEDQGPYTSQWLVDRYASSISFDGWAEPHGEWRPPPDYEPLVVWQPRTWLLKIGWSKHHKRISMFEVPGGAEPLTRAAAARAPGSTLATRPAAKPPAVTAVAGR